jgi:DNA repair exonuclease SbcCD ATPase subunit
VSLRKSDVVAAECDERVNNALTDLSAYALTLDSERLRLDTRMRELARSDSSVEERFALLREHDEILDELDALRAAINALREQIPRLLTLGHAGRTQPPI